MKKLLTIATCFTFYSAHCMEKEHTSLQAHFIKTLTKSIITLSPENTVHAFEHNAHHEISCFFSSPYALYEPKQLSARLRISHDTYKKAYKKTIKHFTDAQMDELFKKRLV